VSILPLLARLAWKQLQIDTDILLIITSTNDELFNGVNRWPQMTINSQNRRFVLFAIFDFGAHFKSELCWHGWKIGLDNLQTALAKAVMCLMSFAQITCYIKEVAIFITTDMVHCKNCRQILLPIWTNSLLCQKVWLASVQFISLSDKNCNLVLISRIWKVFTISGQNKRVFMGQSKRS